MPDKTKMLHYALLDIKSGEFEPPFRAINDVDAQRGILLGIRSGKPMFAQFPEDYALYFVGHFDTVEGTLVSSGKPRHVVNVSSLVIAANVQQKGPSDA